MSERSTSELRPARWMEVFVLTDCYVDGCRETDESMNRQNAKLTNKVMEETAGWSQK